METNRSRSSSGCAVLFASSRTRALKPSQDNSLLKNRSGDEMSTFAVLSG